MTTQTTHILLLLINLELNRRKEQWWWAGLDKHLHILFSITTDLLIKVTLVYKAFHVFLFDVVQAQT